MEKPYKFTVWNKVTKEESFYNSYQSIPYFYLYNKDIIVWIDTRYEAKKRLYEYLYPEQKRVAYNPYLGTEIGKTIPILNF